MCIKIVGAYYRLSNKYYLIVLDYDYNKNFGFLKSIKDKDIEVVVYEPILKDKEFMNSKVVNDLEQFKSLSDVIVANRMDEALESVKEKVYTRDVFGNN